MARKLRIWYPGAIYHIMSRGNRKAAIFNDDKDCLFFLELLKTVVETYKLKVHAICLMYNHFHIEVETTEFDLARAMQKLLSEYAIYFNRRYTLTGHVFQGRYKASIIEDERYFLEVSRYIHLNPVKAKLAKRPDDYEYSSYQLYVLDTDEIRKSKAMTLICGMVDTSRVLIGFGEKQRQNYRQFVEGAMSHTEQEQQIMKDMNEDEHWLPF